MSFGSFTQEAAYKDMKNIQQFYDDAKIFEIVGREVNIAVTPDKIRNLEFDVYIQETTTTAVYRDSANQFLMQLWQAGQISVEQLLEHGDFPFADELLQGLQAQQQAQESAEETLEPNDNGEKTNNPDRLRSGLEQALLTLGGSSHRPRISSSNFISSPTHTGRYRYPSIPEIRRMLRRK